MNYLLYSREGDVDDLKEKIDYFFSHQDLRNEMGRRSLDIQTHG